ncbi:hypothetical protein [Paenibacillus anseongense]|uniref:hypothetical protein n=1 Tax=Paenibacillus anseongense TaxID=2682845 RepID=UPI002DB7AA1C|nr:hypothetical protein [Paenibacillus anseongense]MEC0265530.1 hypothetical protein [Paenibacillus anseongense]
MNSSLFRNRAFIILMIGEAIQGGGIWTSIIANLQFMQSHVPSDLGKSLILMCGLFLGVLISPQAGVWADRYDKKKSCSYQGSFVVLLRFVCSLLYITNLSQSCYCQWSLCS